MKNDIYSRDRTSYNFPDGLRIGGITLSGVDGAKAVSMKVKDSDLSTTNLYDWVRQTHITIESILEGGLGGGTGGDIVATQITDATALGVSLLKATSQTVAQNLLGLNAYATITTNQIVDATAFGKAMFITSNASTGRSLLALGSAATSNVSAFATAIQGTRADSALQPGVLPAGTTLTAAQISDVTTIGRSLLSANTVVAAQSALGLGTAALSATTAFATSNQGTKADTALQPGALPAGTTVAALQISDSTSIGRSLLTAANQAALQTIVGANPTVNITASQISDATAVGRTLMTAADAAAQRTALGLGTAAVAASTAFAPMAHAHSAIGISDATTAGRALLTAADVAAQRTALGLGSAAQEWVVNLATAAQGTKADTALQPGALPAGTTLPAAQISDSSSLGRSLLTSSTQALAQSALGLGSAALSATTAFASMSHTHTAGGISDSTVAGRALLTAADVATQRTALGLGSAAQAWVVNLATAEQGAKADTALQPSAIGTTVAGLSGGKLDSSVIPDMTFFDYLGPVASQTAMLALVGQKGDWCTRSDTGTSWIVTGVPSNIIGNWAQLTQPGSDVISVAGRTGAVTLTATDITNSTAVGRTLLTAADAAAQRTALGLGSAAQAWVSTLATAVQGTKADTALQPGVLPAGTTLPSAQISDATAAGRALLTAADAAAQRTALGLNSAATAFISSFATAAQGAKADTALQPGVLPGSTTLTTLQISNATTPGRALLTAADNAAQRTALGLGTAAVASAASFATATQGAWAASALQPGALPNGTTVTSEQISDITYVGKALITAADAPAQRTALGLGSAAQAYISNLATSAQGIKADTALQPGALPVGTTIPVAQISTATTAGKALLTAADAAAQRTALGLGTAALSASTAFASMSHTHTAGGISDSTAVGRALLMAADVATQRTALGLGTAALSAATAFATLAQGTKADTALQPGVLPAGTTLPVAQISNATTAGRALLTAADAASQRTTLGLGSAALSAATAFATAAHTHTAANISDATTAGRTVLMAVDSAAQRTALGLGTAAVAASTAFAAASHTHTAANISDSTAVGRTLLMAADAAAQRTALGLGTVATTAATAYATAAQGTKADTALQPGALPTGTTLPAAQISNASVVGRTLLMAADAAAQRTALGLAVTDTTSFLGGWATMPDPTTLAVGNKVIINDFGSKLHGAPGVMEMFVSRNTANSTNYYTLGSGGVTLYESLHPTSEAYTTITTTTEKRVATSVECRAPANLALRSKMRYTFVIDISNRNPLYPGSLAVRYGGSRTTSDLPVCLPISDTNFSNTVAVTIDLICTAEIFHAWCNFIPNQSNYITPIPAYLNTAIGQYNAFTVWYRSNVQSGGGESVRILYQKLEIDF